MRSPGFSLVEALIATVVFGVVAASMVALVNPLQGSVQAQPESADLQQRLRVAVSAVGVALRGAGAGSLVGPARGPLFRGLPPIVPYRLGQIRPDVPAGVRYRPDVVSVVSAPITGAQVTLREVARQGTTMLDVVLPATCPPPSSGRVCGFAPGVRALIHDGTGAWDLMVIAAVDGETLHVEIPGGLSFEYGAGAIVTEVAVRSYSIGTDTTGVPRLLQYDGFRGEFPVVDHVVSLGFEYYGDPQPPSRLEDVPLSGSLGPWTTYGPRPPEVDVDDTRDSWPAGENCAFRVDGGQHVPRLPVLGTGTALVPLSEQMLTDGPWCPDAAHPLAFDVDLLRIRRVRVVLRLQVSSSALRGGGQLFARPGRSTSAERFVPDQQIEFDVAPPNMATRW